MPEAYQNINIRDYWQILLKKKWLLIMPAIIVPLAAILVTFFMTPKYQSSTSILINEPNILPPTVQRSLESANQMRRLSPSDIRNILYNQIRSTKYIKCLIAKLNIPIPKAIKEAVAEQIKNMPDVSAAELTDNLLVSSIRERIDVRMEGSNIIRISAVSSSPTMARKMTQTLAEIFLEENLAQELAGIQGSISFTEDQLNVYQEKLSIAEDKLKKFRQQMITTSVDGDAEVLNLNLNSILSVIEALDIEIDEAQQEMTDLRYILYSKKIDVSTIQQQNDIVRLKNELMSTNDKLADLLSRHNWRNAKVIALNKDAKDLLASIESEIINYVGRVFKEYPDDIRDDIVRYLVLEMKIEFTQAKRSALEQSLGRIKSRLTRNPDIEITLERLQSEVNRYRELYNLFVQHSQYAAIEQSAKKIEARSKYMIIQPAVLPMVPTSPNRKKIVFMGLVLGIMVGFGAILLIEYFDDSFKKVEDVENYLNIPVLAIIPRISIPYYSKKKGRGFIFLGVLLCLILAVVIIFMRFKNG